MARANKGFGHADRKRWEGFTARVSRLVCGPRVHRHVTRAAIMLRVTDAGMGIARSEAESAMIGNG
jgi:hypothetical protein